MSASLQGTRDCVTAWTTDFRPDCRRVDVPALVVHGAADRILPVAATAVPLHERLHTSRLVVIDGAPHGLTWTHAEHVNRELLAFLAQRAGETFSRDDLLHEVWHSSSTWQNPTTVTEHIHRLRGRIEPDPSRPRLICTVRGSGYCFGPPNKHRVAS